LLLISYNACYGRLANLRPFMLFIIKMAARWASSVLV
jgi:hypothetical protein